MNRIMIVDNHPLIGMGLSALLTNNGYEVIGSETTGDSAMKSALLLQPNLIILDLYLPDYHGLEVAKLIRDTGMKTKIIVFTAYNDMNSQLKCKEVGVEGYMLKNELSETLISIVGSVMAGGICYPGIGETTETSELPLHNVVLTQREKVILKYLASGMNNRDIAFELDISEKTVSTHKRRIMTKFQADNMVGLLSNTRNMLNFR
ncbi:TPA: response regulator transcription factor [Enterobacter kobei]|nr:response regulator transcription factor [Enterobacter kobei]